MDDIHELRYRENTNLRALDVTLFTALANPGNAYVLFSWSVKLKFGGSISKSFTRNSIACLLLLVSALAFASNLKPAKAAMVPYDSGNPTPEEQLVLEYVNRARANPIAEGQRLGIDIHEGLDNPQYVGPRPPLAMSPELLSIAEGHSEDMYNQNYYSHNDPNGSTPFDRMTNAGYSYVMAGENMAGSMGSMSPGDIEDFMMVDSGTAGRLHRVNLLDIWPYPCSGGTPCIYQEIGIGYVNMPTPNSIGLTTMITEDFGASMNGPFLLGAVYNDLNGNNFYDIGEGIGGVTITPSSGSYYAISSSSGGYAIPVGTSGTITVTAQGPGFGPITKTVTLTGTNVKLDFTSNSSPTTTITTSAQTSSTSTSQTITTTQMSSTQSSTTTSPYTSQTTTFNYVPPSITLNTPSTSIGSTVHVSGAGFATSDTTCNLSGDGVVNSQSCTLVDGTLSASFTVGNVSTRSYTITATGSPNQDTASAVLLVTSNTNQATTTTTGGIPTSTKTIANNSTATQSSASGFAIIPSTSAITLTQGGAGSETLTVFFLNGFNSSITLIASWLENSPSGVTVNVLSPLTPSGESQATSQLTVTANSTATPGSFIIRITGSNGSMGQTESTDIGVNISQATYTTTQTEATTSTPTPTTSSTTISVPSTSMTLSLPTQPASCVVSSSTAGSDLAPLVQKLRLFRDQLVLKSKAGTAFLLLFNTWYYSFSPQLSTFISTHSTDRSTLRGGLYPLVTALFASYYAYSLASPLGVEAATILAGTIA
ncbi:MAG TPA: CFI-box-CTERM domain-containing protein, partial [Candidatus Acidoferrales bacterium]|nr:CFI-box-CTERM domain-containing protein [Candidatus Acidoferrales bacterium]